MKNIEFFMYSSHPRARKKAGSAASCLFYTLFDRYDSSLLKWLAKKLCRRGFCGWSKISAGVPSS